MITDDMRLAFLMEDCDGYFRVYKDRFDYAAEVAEENGKEPEDTNYQDELEGFRRMVDEAMRVHNYIRK